MGHVGEQSSTQKVGIGAEEAVEGKRGDVGAVLLVQGPGVLEAVELAKGQARVIGRHLPADVVIADPELSRLHVRLSFDGERLLVEDLGSRNGTMVSGKPLGML